METKTRFVLLSENDAEAKNVESFIRHRLTFHPQSEDECFTDTLSFTADFGNGIEMDDKLCGVDYESGGDNRPWTEAVLFKNGSEIGHTDPDDKFFTIWEIEDDDIRYRVIVIVPETGTGSFMDMILQMYETNGNLSGEDVEELCIGYLEAFTAMRMTCKEGLQPVMGYTSVELQKVMGFTYEEFNKWVHDRKFLFQIIHDRRRSVGQKIKQHYHGLNTRIRYALQGKHGPDRLKEREIVLHGQLTKEQTNIMMDCCGRDHGGFIPMMVGIENHSYADFRIKNLEGLWAYITSIEDVNQAPGKDITPGMFVEKFQYAARRNWAPVNPDACGYYPDYKEACIKGATGKKEKWRGFSAGQIYDLWQEFGDVPMDPITECIESDWNGFSKGTFREDIWHWFEDEFELSVATNLMGQ